MIFHQLVMDMLNSAVRGYLWLLASISIPANDFPEWHLLPTIGRMEGRGYRKKIDLNIELNE